ncbi:MAG: hypothetical protein BMS9Abin28_0541 [Anaerolineae bacterium]|nr:MAG: hypothetical protein BMS9Abin28_0541 [Anaerolineae bacterium]
MARLHPITLNPRMHHASASAPELYWAEFDVRQQDLEFIDNLLLEREVPLTIEEMSQALVVHRLELIRIEQESQSNSELKAYMPGGEYEVGESLIFHLLDNRVGTVSSIREANNPDLPPFEVIQVGFEDRGEPKEFAARLQEHALNAVATETDEIDSAASPEFILERYGPLIAEKIEARLLESPDTVRIAGRWFHSGLLADINEGHLNLAEAVLDVAEGGPLPTRSLADHMELPAGLDPLFTEFSVNFALQEDERFDEVGPAGKVLWYLKRLEPNDVLRVPKRLAYTPRAYDRERLTDELLALEQSLDDELSEVKAPDSAATEGITLPILFPHLKAGTLPLSARLLPLFPTAYEAPRIRFILIDERTRDQFPGWVVREERYVYGLGDWYSNNDVPAGGLIKITPSETEGEVLLQALEPRQRNDWIRTVTIDDGGNIGFTVLKHPVGTAYDERMIVGQIDERALDEAWENGDQRRMPPERLTAQVFRELAKLNPQASVHAKSLYSAVNVIRRLPPGPIFAELVTQPFYEHVGDLYWKLNESEWKKA